MSLQTLSESEIIMTLVALALLLAAAFGVGTFMEKIKAPRVVGEITGGILLGGTFLYHFFPDVGEWTLDLRGILRVLANPLMLIYTQTGFHHPKTEKLGLQKLSSKPCLQMIYVLTQRGLRQNIFQQK